MYACLCALVCACVCACVRACVGLCVLVRACACLCSLVSVRERSIPCFLNELLTQCGVLLTAWDLTKEARGLTMQHTHTKHTNNN